MMLLKSTQRAVAVFLLVFGLGVSSASAQQTNTMPNVRHLFRHTEAAINLVIASQTDFNIARSENNERGMQNSALALLLNLITAEYWSAQLDMLVTATSHTQAIDEQVANLASRISGAVDALEDDVLSGDMAAIGQRLDEGASDTFTSVINDLVSLNAIMFPQ